MHYNPDKLWWTSDTHYFHAGIIEFSKRPFDSVKEMHEALIQNWNDRVRPGDTVIHVGDFIFGSSRNWNHILDQLHGDIVLVEGNHDRGNKPNATTRGRFKLLARLLEERIGDHYFAVCHYPMLSWRNRQGGSIHVHGHSHGGRPDEIICPTDGTVVIPKCRRFDVGVDCSTRFGAPAYSPISNAELVERALKVSESRT